MQLAEALVGLPGAVGGVHAELLLLRGGGAVPQPGPPRVGRDGLLLERGGQALPAVLGCLQVGLQLGRVDLEAVAQDHRQGDLVRLRGLRAVAQGRQEERGRSLGVPLEAPARHELEGLEGRDALQHVQDQQLAEQVVPADVYAGGADGLAHVGEGRVGRLVLLQALPGEQLEEGDPHEEVAQGVGVGADEVPVGERVREHAGPQRAAVHVLEGEDAHFHAERAEVLQVQRELLPRGDHGVGYEGQGHGPAAGARRSARVLYAGGQILGFFQ